MDHTTPKKIDSITILLWIFILFIILVFGYLMQVSIYVGLHANYQDKVNKLKIIDKEFDNFLLQQAVFINYDKINKNIFSFDKDLKYLASKEALKTHSPEYSSLLKEVKQLYKNKLSSIEYFKSENSQFLYSMHYLFDLNLAILESKNIDEKNKNIVNSILLQVTKQYINATIDNTAILKQLNSLNQNSKDNDLIKMFISHIKILMLRTCI